MLHTRSYSLVLETFVSHLGGGEIVSHDFSWKTHWCWKKFRRGGCVFDLWDAMSRMESLMVFTRN